MLCALFLQIIWSCPLAADGPSFFVPECNGVTFHIVKVDGLKSRQELVLRVNSGLAPWRVHLPEKDWREAIGERCSADGKCERAASARIWIEKAEPNSKHVSAKYDVTFRNQHLEGQFAAKMRKHSPAVDCL